MAMMASTLSVSANRAIACTSTSEHSWSCSENFHDHAHSCNTWAAFSGLRRENVASVFIKKENAYVSSEATPRLRLDRKVSIVAMAASTGGVPSLNELQLVNYINQQGRIQPPLEPNTEASVFAVFDSKKKIHYIGFSKDVRNSLRTLMGRRPELCFYYRIHNLTKLDQQQMLAVREQWINELGLAPTGNSDPAQRKQWELPSDAGSISERGRAAAAASKAKSFLQIMADRGLKEEMIYDPQLLEEGKCDILPSKDQTVEEIQAAADSLAEAAAKRRSSVVVTPNGSTVEFEIFFEQKQKTNGGWMYDILVSKDDKETRHRVICGHIYPEAANMNEDRFVEVIIGFLLFKKVPRHTEGLMTGDMFPINYFAVSEVAQDFPELKDWFDRKLPDSYWRFNKIHSYGAAIDPAPLVGPSYNVLTEGKSSLF